MFFALLNLLVRPKFALICLVSFGCCASLEARENDSTRNSPRLSPHLISFEAGNLGVSQQGSQFDFQIPTDNRTPDSSAMQDLETIEGIESFPFRGEEVERKEEEPTTSANGREIIRQRYSDGKVQIEREVEQDDEGNYYNHGFWRVKSPDGTVVAQGEFDRGQMDGIWERKHTKDSSPLFQGLPFRLFQGPFTSTATFSGGKLDGVWTMNDQYNRKVFEIRYQNGKRDGMAIWWYPSMTKMREVQFQDGVINGPLREWDQQNKIVRDEEFVEGKKIIRNVSYYRPKQLQAESFYLGAKLEAEGEDDWWDAKPAKLVSFGKEIQHGPLKAWYDNGLPKMKGQYDSGERVGRFSWWYENGNKRLDGSYIGGEKVGRWTWWHQSGMKAIEGNYDNGRPVGLWKRWTKDGQLEDEKNLSENRDAVPEGTPDNPADLPMGITEPVTEPVSQEKNAAPSDDDNEIELMLEGGELEGIEPLESDG